MGITREKGEPNDFSDLGPVCALSASARLRKESRDRILGLVSRAERLLRLRSVRLALGGSPNRIDFAKLLDDRIVLINLAPPQGSTDIGKFMAGLVWIQINHAIRRRPNGSAPTFVMVDEWPTFLAAGGAHLADTFEDLLRLARSKGVFLAVLSQDMSSVAKVSHSIADVVKNNLHTHFIFRAMDSNAWDFALPATGRRPKPSGAPWEERRAGYLDRGAELTLLRDGLERLADRHCYVDRLLEVRGSPRRACAGDCGSPMGSRWRAKYRSRRWSGRLLQSGCVCHGVHAGCEAGDDRIVVLDEQLRDAPRAADSLLGGVPRADHGNRPGLH